METEELNFQPATDHEKMIEKVLFSCLTYLEIYLIYHYIVIY